MKQHELNTNGWNEFPFEVNGTNFISKIAPTSPFMKRIPLLPAGVFESMNKDAVLDCIGKGLTRDEMIEKIYLINAGASHAVLEVA
jgi:hypothetical protein